MLSDLDSLDGSGRLSECRIILYLNTRLRDAAACHDDRPDCRININEQKILRRLLILNQACAG